MARLTLQASRATAVTLEGRELAYFGGCGYLGLAHHPRVVEALTVGLARYGVSSGAARETTGNAAPHEQLELELARRLDVGATLLLPEGYTANFAAAQVLAGDHDLALIDEHSHASLFDAASAARLDVRSFPHGDLSSLRTLCSAARGRRVVIASDTVFPSLGHIAPLRELAFCAEDAQAALWLDDCHGLGVIGAHGLGALEHANLKGGRVVLTATLSKALGCYGGFLAADSAWIERARATAQAYLGTTPIPPALAAAACVALELAFDQVELIGRLRANTALVRAGFERLELPVPDDDLPVFAFALESRARMDAVFADLCARGILAPLIRYPGGPAQGNFRIVVSAAHSLEELEHLLDALRSSLRGNP